MKRSKPFQNSKLPIEQRVSDLIDRVTLPEKLAQLVGTFGLEEEDSHFSLLAIMRHCIHSGMD